MGSLEKEPPIWYTDIIFIYICDRKRSDNYEQSNI